MLSFNHMCNWGKVSPFRTLCDSKCFNVLFNGAWSWEDMKQLSLMAKQMLGNFTVVGTDIKAYTKNQFFSRCKLCRCETREQKLYSGCKTRLIHILVTVGCLPMQTCKHSNGQVCRYVKVQGECTQSIFNELVIKERRVYHFMCDNIVRICLSTAVSVFILCIIKICQAGTGHINQHFSSTFNINAQVDQEANCPSFHMWHTLKVTPYLWKWPYNDYLYRYKLKFCTPAKRKQQSQNFPVRIRKSTDCWFG